MQTRNLAGLYKLDPLDWEPIRDRLQQGLTQAPGTGSPDRHTTWLTTINPDGSPHVTGVGGHWDHDAFWFVTGERTRKATNVARDPRCVVSVAAREFDVVIEGTAEQVTDPEQVAEIAARAAAEGWPASVDESGVALTAEYSAPSAGPPPWHVYKIMPQRATALQTVDPGGATSWTFDQP